jgi:hypothetical protein
MADLHVLRETNLKNVSATLRKLCDDIDNNVHGEVRAACIVLDALKLEVHFMGEGEAGPEAYLLLGMGQYKMAKLIYDEKERNP